MDPADVARRITDKTRVISPIHSCGRVCDMDRLLDIADAHGVVVVEDAAHAHGSEWDGVKIGNLGHIACFSMQGSTPGGKPVAGGEAGIVATNDRELYERAIARQAETGGPGYIPPDDVAGLVFDGVREGRFYIFTHPEATAQRVRERTEALAALDPPALAGSIF